MEARRPFEQAVNAREADPRLKRAKPRRVHVRSRAARAAAEFLVVLAALLALPLQAEAQTTLVSNTGQTADPASIGDTSDRAQAFTTGANSGGYTLSSVEFISRDLDGDDAAVSVCTVDLNGFPTSTCTTLTAPSSFAVGTLEFTGNMTLAANTTYTLLLATPGGESLQMGSTSSASEDTGGATGWLIDDAYDFKHFDEGVGVWRTTTAGKSFRIAVNGTVVGGTTLSTDATLSDLELEDNTGTAITLTPTFVSGTTSYTAMVANSVDEITIAPTVNDSNAEYEIQDSGGTALTDADSNTTGFQVALSEGENTIKVEVTAEDNSTPETYTVVVTREMMTTTPTAPALSIADASAAENAGHLLFGVTLSRSLPNTVKVDFETISGGTATEGVDYHARRTYTHVILAGDRTAQMGFALISSTTPTTARP